MVRGLSTKLSNQNLRLKTKKKKIVDLKKEIYVVANMFTDAISYSDDEAAMELKTELDIAYENYLKAVDAYEQAREELDWRGANTCQILSIGGVK